MTRTSDNSSDGECFEHAHVQPYSLTRRRRYAPMHRYNIWTDPILHAHNHGGWQWPMMRTGRLPNMDFKDKGDSYVLTAEIPGVKKENIDITLTDNRIHIKTNNEEEKMEEGECYVCQERTSTKFHRTFEFPEIIDPDAVDATLEDGILSVTLGKKDCECEEEVKTVKIT